MILDLIEAARRLIAHDKADDSREGLDENCTELQNLEEILDSITIEHSQKNVRS